MKLERISLPAAAGTSGVVDLTPGLTVVEASPGRTTPVVGALVEALASAEDGVHVEFALDDGTALVAFRPAGAGHRVIDLASGADVSADHARPGGGVDVLAAWRREGPILERELVCDGAELASPDPTEQWMAAISALEPDRLLSAAEAEVDAEQALRRATAAARATPEDLGAAARLADARRRRASAEGRHRRLRVATFVAGAVVPVATLIGLNTAGTAAGGGLLLGTLVVAAGCLVGERRMQRAIDAEDAAIRDGSRPGAAGPAVLHRTGSDVGEPSAADGQSTVQESAAATGSAAAASVTAPERPAGSTAPDRSTNAAVLMPGPAAGEAGNGAAASNGALNGNARPPTVVAEPPSASPATPGPDAHRPAADAEPQARLQAAAERYQSSAASWQRLAGNVPAPWVLTHRDRVRATAQLRAAVQAEEPPSSGTESQSRSASLRAGIISRAAANRVRAGGEALPLLLDEPLAGLDWVEKAPVLEFLGRLARHQQVVVVTADTEVLSWARLEATTGSIGMAPGLAIGNCVQHGPSDDEPDRHGETTASPSDRP